jgi:hypothetical protein
LFLQAEELRRSAAAAKAADALALSKMQLLRDGVDRTQRANDSLQQTLAAEQGAHAAVVISCEKLEGLVAQTRNQLQRVIGNNSTLVAKISEMRPKS